MKNLLFITLLFIACACTQNNPDEMVVKVKVNNMTYSKIALFFDPSNITELELDKNGEATFRLQEDIAYPYLAYGNDAKQLFLEKGEQVDITFDANNFKGTFEFKGKNAPIIDYLNAVTYSKLEDETYALPLNEFMDFIQNKTDDFVKLLKARKLESINPDFVKLEEGRIWLTNYTSNLFMYPIGHLFMAKDTNYQPGDDYYTALENTLVENENWIRLPEFQNLFQEVAYVLANHETSNYLKKDINKEILGMKYIIGHVKSDKIKQIVLNNITIKYIKLCGIQNIAEMENLYKTYVTDPALLAKYKEEYDKKDLTIPGRPSPDFQAKNIDGKTYSLKDFKGKYVYIDVWATWCGPCNAALPYLKELEKKFEGKNITFLGLSIDADIPAWEKEVKSGKLYGTQLLLGKESSFQKNYQITGIPRFILLDPEGKIVNSDAVRPSSKDAERILSALPGI